MSGIRSTSPDGRYAVQVEVWEAFNSHWVESPRIIEKATGEVVLVFRDDTWSLDQCRWTSADVVELTLRKYPGNHVPAGVVARIDIARRTASVDAGPQLGLDALEAALDARLSWG